jgi:hypothetical protein
MHEGVVSQAASLAPAVIPLYAVQFVLFFLPGLWGVVLFRRAPAPAAFASALAVVFSALVGYGVFWAYFAGPVVGRAASAAVLGGSLGALAVRPARAAFLKVLRQPDVSRPLLLTGAAGLFGVAFLYALRIGAPPEEAVRYRFPFMTWTIDNQIPLWLAEELYAGHDPRRLFDGRVQSDWLSSDRPPLQAGLVLVQRPLASLTGQPPGLCYQTLATLLQATWVPAAWAVARLAGLRGRRLALVLALLLASGFTLYHALFVWPKLLSGALGLAAVGLLVLRERPGERLPGGRVVLAAVAAALGMLAHGGVAFTLLGAGLFLLRPRYFPGLKGAVAGLAAFAALLLPWQAYARFYDPPGNRLLKWHLAGVIPIDPRPTGRTVLDAYAAAGWRRALTTKVVNAYAVLGWPLAETGEVHGWPTGQPAHEAGNEAAKALGWWRNQEYWHVLKALGVLNVGWLVLLASLVRRGPPKEEPFLAASRTLLGVALVSLVVWVLLLFFPGEALILHCSYATMLLLFLGLGMQLAALPRYLSGTLLGIQVADFAVTWLLARPTGPDLDLGMTGTAVLALAAVVLLLRRVTKEPSLQLASGAA